MRKCMHVELLVKNNCVFTLHDILRTVDKASHIPAPVIISYASLLKTSLPKNETRVHVAI